MSASRARIIVAITGASGATYGVRLLQELQNTDIETHLLVSDAAVINLHQELALQRKDVESLASVVHNVRNIGASIASGSFQTLGMIVAPCSMKTLAAIAHGFSDNLIARAGDVVLKERRRLVLLVRESPLNLAHLRNMSTVTEMGGIICLPVPAFYHHPQSIDDIVDQTNARLLDLFGLQHRSSARWQGLSTATSD